MIDNPLLGPGPSLQKTLTLVSCLVGLFFKIRVFLFHTTMIDNPLLGPGPSLPQPLSLFLYVYTLPPSLFLLPFLLPSPPSPLLYMLLLYVRMYVLAIYYLLAAASPGGGGGGNGAGAPALLSQSPFPRSRGELSKGILKEVRPHWVGRGKEHPARPTDHLGGVAVLLAAHAVQRGRVFGRLR